MNSSLKGTDDTRDDVASSERKKRKRNASNEKCFPIFKRHCIDVPDVTANDSAHIKLTNFMNLVHSTTEDQNFTLDVFEEMIDCLKVLRKSYLLSAADVCGNLSNFLHVLCKFISDKTKVDFEAVKKQQIELGLSATLVCFSVFANRNMPCMLYIEDLISTVVGYLKQAVAEFLISFKSKKTLKTGSNKNLSSLQGILNENLTVLSEFIILRNFNSMILKDFILTCLQVIFQGTGENERAFMSVVKASFSKRVDFRTFLLNEFLLLIKKIPRKGGHLLIGATKLSKFSVFIMTLIQSIVDNPDWVEENGSIHIKESWLDDSYYSIWKVIGVLTYNLINYCSAVSTDGYKIYRSYLESFVKELLEISNLPEWPLAKLILHMLGKHLVGILKNSQKTEEASFKVFALKILGEITKKAVKDERKYSEIAAEGNSKLMMSEISNHQEIISAYLNNSTELMKINQSALLVHQLHWFQNLKRDPGSQDIKSLVCKLFAAADSTSSDYKKTKTDEIRAIIFLLDKKRFNYTNPQVFFNYILQTCFDPNKILKNAGTRCLSELLLLDPMLLGRPAVSNTMDECLSASSTAVKEELCSSFSKFLIAHPEKSDEYNLYFLRYLLINEGTFTLKRNSIQAAKDILLHNPTTAYRNEMCYKVLSHIHDEDASIRGLVSEFCTDLWVRDGLAVDHIETFLSVMQMGSAITNFRLVIEEQIKSGVLTEWKHLVSALVARMNSSHSKDPLRCLQVLSVFTDFMPDVLRDHIPQISNKLCREEYSTNFAEEILAADVLAKVLRTSMPEPAEANLLRLSDALMEKLKSPESFNFGVTLTVAFLKLIRMLPCRHGQSYIFEDCFVPSLEILKQHLAGKASDFRTVARALKIVTYLFKDCKKESNKCEALQIIDQFLENKTFASLVIHCFCYLSVEYKQIMNHLSLKNAITKYLSDRQQFIMTQAVLYNILCCLKPSCDKESITKIRDADSEIISEVLQTYLPKVLECTQDIHLEIRNTACLIIECIVKTGLLAEFRLFPYVVVMTTDLAPSVKRLGTDLLKLMLKNKDEDFLSLVEQGVIMSFRFHEKIDGKNLVRGFYNSNGKLQARCSYLYSLLQHDTTERRKLVDLILNKLQSTSAATMSEKLYLVDHLASFSYKYQDEVIYIIRGIEHMESLLSIPENDTQLNSEESRDDFMSRYYGHYLVTPLKDYLRKCYGITNHKMVSYAIDTKKELTAKTSTPGFLTQDDMLPSFENRKVLFEKMFCTLKSLISGRLSCDDGGKEQVKVEKRVTKTLKSSSKIQKSFEKEHISSPTSAIDILDTKAKIPFICSTPKSNSSSKSLLLPAWFSPKSVKKN